MPQVHLSDQVFNAAQRHASDGGYSSVDEYIADVVVHDAGDESENLNPIFTPERLAELERISAEIKAGGNTHSMVEVHQHFERKRKEWLENHAT